MTVRHLSLDYDKVNDGGTFSPGDVLSGRVTVATAGETRVQRLSVTAKGKATVAWSEPDGSVVTDKKIYFEFEQIILQDKNKGDGSEIMRAGQSFYPFTFVIPNTDMPSSFTGKWGKITYSLRAQLTRSIWHVHKTKLEIPFLTRSEFPFASRSEAMIIGLKEQQSASRVSFLGSGPVTMNVTSEKMALGQGEAMAVSVEVVNGSACSITPKFFFCEKQTFVAQSRRMIHANEIQFGTGDSVSAGSSGTITNVLRVPGNLPPTFLNCSMMNLEYRLKVTLNVPMNRHPEVRLPLVILLRTPRPEKQKPKRSIWFRRLSCLNQAREPEETNTKANVFLHQ